jgi:hypothetical protein
VVQDSFVEGGEHVELSRGKQVDEVPADVLHVPGCRLLDGGAAGLQQADQGAAGVVGVGLAADQPVLLLDADGKIAEVTIFWRPLPSGVALQRNLADALGMQPWELRTNGE